MWLRRVLAAISLLVSLACLAWGYAAAGYGAVAALALVPGAAACAYRKYAAAWLLPVCLAALICLAAGGLLLGSPGFLMIAGATAALAAWDLANLDIVMADGSPSRAGSRLEKEHLQSLTAALGAGLLLAGGGLIVSLRLPFVLLLALIAVDLYGLDRAYRYLKQRNR